VDFIHVLTYDYNGPWEAKTAHASPLHLPGDSAYPISGVFPNNQFLAYIL